RNGCEIEMTRGVRAMGFLRTGQLWVERAGGIELWEIDTERIVAREPTLILRGTRARRFLELSDGLAILTDDRRVIWTDGRTERVILASPDVERLNDVVEDASGNLWLATDGGLVAIRRQGVTLFSAHSDLKPPLLRTLVRDPNGQLHA